MSKPKQKSKQKIRPISKWLLVEPLLDKSIENEHGLILPASEEREQKAQGKVLAIGDEVTKIKVGEVVIFGAYAGEVLKTSEDGEEVLYNLLMEEDIIAIIE